MLRYLGSKSIALAVPILAALMATLDLAGLQGELAALLTLVVTFTPPSVGLTLDFIAQLQAALQIQFPSIDIKADLELRIKLLELKIKLLLQITDLLLATGLHMYDYSGEAGSFGAALTGEFAPGPSQGGIVGTENIYAVVLVVEASADVTVKATKELFGTE